mgnify:CR=1 FL=1
MDFYSTERDDGCLRVEQTVAGRLANAGARFVIWAPVAMGGLSILFMPDYVCHYREQADVPGLFWAVLAVCALFIAAVGAFVRFSRRDSWSFDAGRREIVFRAQPMVGRSAETTADLSDWTGVYGESGPLFSRSMIGVTFGDRHGEVICESRFGWAPIENVYDAFESFVRERNLDVEVERTG